MSERQHKGEWQNSEIEMQKNSGQALCMECGKALTNDETALHKKLYNRAAKSFLCIKCSSRYLGVTEDMLNRKIQEFKKMGCTLFI